MSKKTGAQMEALLTEKIEKTKIKLTQLQQKHKLEIGTLAYKHGLDKLDLNHLNQAFAKLAEELKS